MTRKERRQKAALKRETIKGEILQVMTKALDEGEDFSTACNRGNKKIQQLIIGNPREKSLILSAALTLRSELEDAIQARITKRREKYENL